MKKHIMILLTMVFLFGLSVMPSLALDPPVITLERIEVASIQPFFVKPRIEYKSEQEPGKDLAAGAIMNLAVLFSVKNPNKEAVMLDELSFTTMFEGFDINTTMTDDDMWVPAGKTNQLRIIVTNETHPAILNLSVGAGNSGKLQEMKTTPAAMVKKWWDTVSDLAFPIGISGGTAVFKDEKGKETRVTFSGEFPKK